MIEFERTKELAKRRKMTLREVNDKAGFGTNSIYNWKSKKPSSEALKSVAQVLHTSTDYLMGLTDDSMPNYGSGNESIPLDEERPYSYRGYHVPEKYLNMVRGLMEEDIKEEQAKKKNGRQ